MEEGHLMVAGEQPMFMGQQTGVAGGDPSIKQSSVHDNISVRYSRCNPTGLSMKACRPKHSSSSSSSTNQKAICQLASCTNPSS